MKRRRTMVVAVASGVLCAVCVGLFAYGVQNRAEADRAEALERYGGEQVQVCVAARDIAAGEKVEASAVQSRLWVSDLLPDQAIRDKSNVEGRTASSSIIKGEVFTEGRFARTDAALDVPAGLSAVSVPVRTVQAVGGALEAGMHVDVYATGSSQTTAIARSVLVLASSASGSARASDQAYVTLAVEPALVEQVIAASANADLCFVVPGDAGGQSTSAVKAEGGDER